MDEKMNVAIRTAIEVRLAAQDAAFDANRKISNRDFAIASNKAFIDSLATSGYAIVPVEATQGMLDIMHDSFYARIETGVNHTGIEDCAVLYCDDPQGTWRAMLAASQKEPGK